MAYISHHRRDDPNIKGLYAEAHSLRDIVLRRLAGIGCKVNEKSLSKAQAIVSGNIAELVAVPEYETLLNRPAARAGYSRLSFSHARPKSTPRSIRWRRTAARPRSLALHVARHSGSSQKTENFHDG
jgi:hypothetical protein